MEHAILVRSTGTCPISTGLLTWLSRFPSWDVITGNSCSHLLHWFQAFYDLWHQSKWWVPLSANFSSIDIFDKWYTTMVSNYALACEHWAVSGVGRELARRLTIYYILPSENKWHTDESTSNKFVAARSAKLGVRWLKNCCNMCHICPVERWRKQIHAINILNVAARKYE